MQFKELVGTEISLKIPRLQSMGYLNGKLLGVEPSGLWVESQQITNEILEAIGLSTSPRSLVFFWPFHEIAFAMTSIGSPSLNEKAYGSQG